MRPRLPQGTSSSLLPSDFQVEVALRSGLRPLHLQRVRDRIRIVASAGDLPGNFESRRPTGDREATALDLLGNMEIRGRSANRCQLISVIDVDRREPWRQIDPRRAALVE